MKIIIAGSRTFTNYTLVAVVCLKAIKHIYEHEDIWGYVFHHDITFITGGAKGADECGSRFATEYKFKQVCVPADWEKYGKSAGILRNVEMAKLATEKRGEVNLLLAFWDGKSVGTKHMLDTAVKFNIPAYKIDTAGNISKYDNLLALA